MKTFLNVMIGVAIGMIISLTIVSANNFMTASHFHEHRIINSKEKVVYTIPCYTEDCTVPETLIINE